MFYLGGRNLVVEWEKIKQIKLQRPKQNSRKGYTNADLELINGEKHNFFVFADFEISGIDSINKKKRSINLLELREIYF